MQFLVFGTGPQGLGRLGGELRQRLGLLLSGELRANVEVMALPSYGELLRGIGSGTIAVAWVPPAVFVEAHDQHGARLLARAKRRGRANYRAAIVVPPDSDVIDLEDLRGKTMGWVDPESASGYLFVRLEMRERGLDPDTFFGASRFFGSHAAVAQAVASGEVECGATYVYLDGTKVVHSGFGRTGLEMRRVLTSEPFPTDAICVSSALDDRTYQAVRGVLQMLHATTEGRAVLEELFQVESFEEGNVEDYAVVRRALAHR